MAIRFCCSVCGHLLSIATRKAGTETACPVCHGNVSVPASPAASTGVIAPPVAGAPLSLSEDTAQPLRGKARWYASGTGLAIAAAVLVFFLLPAGVVLTQALVFKIFKGGDADAPADTRMALVDGVQDPANKLGVPMDLEVVSRGSDQGLMPGEMALERQKKAENKLGQPAEGSQPKLAQPQPRKEMPPKDSGKVIIPASNVIVPPALGKPVGPPAPTVTVPVETPTQIALREQQEARKAAQRREQILLLNLKLADRAMEKRDFAKALEFYQAAAKIKRSQEVMTGLFLAKLERDQALAQGKRDEAQRRKKEEQERVARVERLREEAMQALNNKEPARAMEAFKEAIKLAPNDVVLQQGLIRTEQMAEQDQRKFLAENQALQQRREKELAEQVAAAGKVLDKERQAAERQRQEADRRYRELAEQAEQTGRVAAAESQKRFANLLRDTEREKREAEKQLATIRQQAEENARAAQAVAEKHHADLLAAANQKNLEAEARLHEAHERADRRAKAAEAAAQKQYTELLAAAERQRKESEQQLLKAREQAAQNGNDRRLADLLVDAERQRKEADRRLATLKEQAEQSAGAAAEAERKRHAETLVAAERQRQETADQQKAVLEQAEKTARAQAEAERKRFADSLLAAERQRREAQEREKQVREQAEKSAQAEAVAAQKRYEDSLRAAERQKQEAEEQFKRILERPQPSVAAPVPPKPAITEAPSPKVPDPVVVQPKVEEPRTAPQLSAAELAARKAQEEEDLKNLARLRAEADKAEAEQRHHAAAAAERKLQEERAKAVGQKLLPGNETGPAPKGTARPGTQKSSRLDHQDPRHPAVDDRSARHREVAAWRGACDRRVVAI
jgi:hypothetical protein